MYERLTYLEKTNKQLSEDKDVTSPTSSADLLADNASLKQEVSMLKDRCGYSWKFLYVYFMYVLVCVSVAIRFVDWLTM